MTAPATKRLERDPTPEMVEAGAAAVYGKNWNAMSAAPSTPEPSPAPLWVRVLVNGVWQEWKPAP